MRNILAAVAVAASVLATSVYATGTAHAFTLQGGGASPQSGSTSLEPGSRYTAPDDKLLSAPLGGLDMQTGTERDGRSVHFGDKNGGLTLQGSPAPGPTGANRYFSMEANPWR